MKHIKLTRTDTSSAAVSLGLFDQLSGAESKQVDLIERLKKDKTKTPTAQELFTAKAGIVHVESLHKKVQAKQKEINAKLEAYQTKIDHATKVQGTTDYLILQSHAPMLKDSSLSDITQMVKASGNVDVLRACLIVPELMLNERFAEGRDHLLKELAHHTLGDADYENLNNLKQAKQHSRNMESGLMVTFGEFNQRIEGIEANVVKDVA